MLMISLKKKGGATKKKKVKLEKKPVKFCHGVVIESTRVKIEKKEVEIQM